MNNSEAAAHLSSMAMNGQHNHGPPVGNESLFLSHAYLGSCVFLLGLWWWFQSLRHCCTVTRRNAGKYSALAYYPPDCLRLPLGEGVLKILVAVLGMIVEAVTVTHGRDKEYAHFPFYSAVLLAGLVEILLATVIFLPEGMEFILQMLPIVFHAFCMRAQAYDQSHVTATCRLITSYMCILTALAMFGEMLARSRFILTWIKCLAVMLTGLWTVQTGWLLSPVWGVPWNEHSHDDLMYVAIYFAWHMFFTATFQLGVFVVYTKVTQTSPYWADESSAQDDKTEMHRIDGRYDVQYTKLLTTEQPGEE